MDNIQNKINDYLSPANERVLRIAEDMTNKELKEKYPNGYNSDIVNELMTKNIEIARKQILEQIKFEQEYKQLRHQGDLQDEQASLDRQQANIRESQLNDQWWLSKQQAYAEEKIITDDLNGININGITENYKDIANYFNIQDTQELFKIFNDNSNNIDFDALEKITMTSLGKERLREIRLNQNNQNKNNFLHTVSNAIQNLANQRVNTASGFMDVAKKDISVRTEGVQQKMDAFNSIREKSMVNDPIYETSLNELDKAKKRLYTEREKQRQIDQVTRQQQLNSINLENQQMGGIKK